MIRIYRCSALILLAGLAGCDSAINDPPLVSVVDSSGIRVVTSHAAHGLDGWVIGPPAVDLATTGSGEAHEFFRVDDMLVTSSGAILVANSASNQLRLFDGSGNLVESVGREGQGPGEYQGFLSLHEIRGDSILVRSRPDRVTVLDADLQFGRTYRMEGFLLSVESLGPDALGALHGFAEAMSFEGTKSEVFRRETPLIRWTLDGVAQDTLFETAGFEDLIVVVEGGILSASFPFQKTAVVSANGKAIATGRGESFEFEIYSMDGELRAIYRVPSYDLTISDAARTIEFDSLFGPNPSRFGQATSDQAPHRAQRPAFTDLVLDDLGYLWVGEHQGAARRNAPRRWDLFDPEGHWLGALETPARFKVRQITENHIVGVWRDDFDIEHPQLLELVRGQN